MTTNDNLDQLGARIYGHGHAAEADTRGGRVYGRNDDMDARGARVYGLGDRGAVSHEQAAADADTATPERWRLNEVRPATAVGSLDDLDAIGTRIEARHHGGGVVTADNRGGRGDTPGLAGFDY